MNLKKSVWLVLLGAGACNVDLNGGEPKSLSDQPDLPLVDNEPIGDREPAGAGGSETGTGGSAPGAGGSAAPGTGGSDAGAGGNSESASGGASAATGGSLAMGGDTGFGGMGGDAPFGGSRQ